jgi:virulence factor Mce-like protein
VRRLASIAVIVAAGIGSLLLAGSGGQGPQTYRVDALFYNASHLIPGQEVKIAGAEVGTVENVKLTKDRRARVQMAIDKRFAPFHADARCTIRPQSLIGEKFVQCVPGTPKAPELKGQGGAAPTIAVDKNPVPVDLDLVFDALRLPYRERFTLIVNELGTGLAGRPKDLNTAIRLANPALDQTNKVLTILDDDRARLGRLIDASDTVLAQLAGKRDQVKSFIDRSSKVAEAVASHSDGLDQTIARLPAMLAQLQPTATDLTALVSEARPELADIRAATPAVRRLANDFGPLNNAARPALIQLADMSKTGRSAVHAATPVAALLKAVASKLPPVTKNVAALVESMRDKGVVEGLQTFIYLATLSTSRFDQTSHILPSYQVASGQCGMYATTPVAGCSAHFSASTAQGSAAKNKEQRTKNKEASAKHKHKHKKRRRHRHHHASSHSGTPASTPASPAAPSVPNLPVPTPQVPPVTDAPGDVLNNVLDFLLGP